MHNSTVNLEFFPFKAKKKKKMYLMRNGQSLKKEQRQKKFIIR